MSAMELSVKTIARDETCWFGRFRPFVAFETIKKMCGCVLIRGNISNSWEESGLHGDNIETILLVKFIKLFRILVPVSEHGYFVAN
jgi:hypothetical protein